MELRGSSCRKGAPEADTPPGSQESRPLLASFPCDGSSSFKVEEEELSSRAGPVCACAGVRVVLLRYPKKLTVCTGFCTFLPRSLK